MQRYLRAVSSSSQNLSCCCIWCIIIPYTVLEICDRACCVPAFPRAVLIPPAGWGVVAASLHVNENTQPAWNMHEWKESMLSPSWSQSQSSLQPKKDTWYRQTLHCRSERMGWESNLPQPATWLSLMSWGLQLCISREEECFLVCHLSSVVISGRTLMHPQY